MGVIYVGFIGAIIFGKVLRIHSRAQVEFSNPIVVRYGSGIANDFQISEDGMIPCPVLEFRVVNKMYDEVGGEIMDANMNCVAILGAPLHKIQVKRSISCSSHITHVAEKSEPTDKALFAKLFIGSEQNPFFKHSWLVQHTLNEDSLLLSIQVRKMIKKIMVDGLQNIMLLWV